MITLTGSRETGVAVLEGGRGQPQARPPRARRQERGHRPRRRRPRPRRRRDHLVGVRHLRPALHRREPRDRPRAASTSELQSKLVAAAEKLRLGPGWEDGTDVGPVINQGALEKIHSYTEIGKDEGATLLTGGEVATGNGLDDGFFYRPTIFGDVEPGMRVAQEEIFGPTTALIPVERRRRGDPRRQRRPVRALVLDLHARREHGLPRDARPRRRASPTSTPARSAPRCISPSAG